MPFDPDEYLAKKKTAFDPDAYLANKQPQAKEQLTAPSTKFSAATQTPAHPFGWQEPVGQAQVPTNKGIGLFTKNLQAPFETLANKTNIPIVTPIFQGVGGALDVAMNVPSGIVQGTTKYNTGLAEGKPLKALSGAGQAAMSTFGVVNPLMTEFNLGQKGVEQLPMVGEPASNLINRVTNPVQTISGSILSQTGTPQTEASRDVAGIFDIPAQAYMFNKGAELLPEARAGLSDIKQGIARKATQSDWLNPERMMQKAIKFQGTEAVRAKKIATSLKEGVIPTSKGLSDYYDKIDRLNDFVTQTLTGEDATIPTKNVLESTKPLEQEVRESQNVAQPTIDDYIELNKQFLKEHGDELSVEQAQKLKRGTYKRQKGYYDRLAKTGEEPPEKAAWDMAIAHGMMKEIEAQFPEIAEPNKRMGSMLDIQKDLERAVRREANSPSFPHSLMAIVNPKWWMAKLFIDNPSLKARVAISLNKMRGGVPSDISKTKTDISQQTKDLPPLNPETGNPAEPTPSEPTGTPTPGIPVKTMPTEAPKGGEPTADPLLERISQTMPKESDKAQAHLLTLADKGIITLRQAADILDKNQAQIKEAPLETPQTGENPQISQNAISNIENGSNAPETVQPEQKPAEMAQSGITTADINKPAESIQPESEQLPTFTGTEKAIEYGRANPDKLDALKARREATLKEFEEKKNQKPVDYDELSKLAVRAQLDREAVEFGSDPTKKSAVESMKEKGTAQKSGTSEQGAGEKNPEVKSDESYVVTGINGEKANVSKYMVDAWLDARTKYNKTGSGSQRVSNAKKAVEREAGFRIKSIEPIEPRTEHAKTKSGKPTSQNTLRPAILKNGKLHIGNIGDTHDNIKTEIA
jgi:hypothetical protein